MSYGTASPHADGEATTSSRSDTKAVEDNDLETATENGCPALSNFIFIPMIGLVMSEKGDISRLLCGKFGGYLTYAALNMSAGQPSIDDLLHVYKIRRVGIDTKVFGVIGNPVAHSRSPLLHNAMFQSVGFDAVYVPLLVDDPEDFLRVYSSPDFSGFSVGIPHKECALKCCDELDPVAKQIGAVNTIVRRPNDGKLIGYNTDCMAAISAIEDAIRGSLDYATTDPLGSFVVYRF